MKERKVIILLMVLAIALLPFCQIDADECIFEFKRGSKVVTLCDKGYKIDVPPTEVEGNLYIPYRFVTEKLGLWVEWNAQERSVAATAEDMTQRSG